MNDTTVTGTTASSITYSNSGFLTIYDGAFATSIPFSSQTKKVKTLNETQKKELSADTQILLEAGFIDSDLSSNSNGRGELLELLFELHKPALVERAKKYIEKNKDN